MEPCDHSQIDASWGSDSSSVKEWEEMLPTGVLCEASFQV